MKISCLEIKRTRAGGIFPFLSFLLLSILLLPAFLICPGQAAAEEKSAGAEKKPAVEFKPRVGGYIEGWYRLDNSDLSNYTAAAENAKRVDNEFRIRRARIDVRGNVTEAVGYRVTANLDGPSPASGAATVKLWDGNITYKAHSLATLTFGQFKYPFTLEGLEGTPDRIPVLRAESINDIASKLGTQGGSFRDIGAQVSGGYKEALGLKYAVALINGSGINKGDNNNEKDLVGKVTVAPLEGLTLGVCGYLGESQDEVAQTPFEVNESAFGAEAEYVQKKLGLSLRGEYVAARWENWNVATGKAEKGKDQKPNGWYLQAAYKLPPLPNLQFMARYENYEKDSNTVDSGLKTMTLGATYYFKDKTRITATYLIRDAGSSSIVTAQETDAKGSKISNLFLVQFLVAY